MIKIPTEKNEDKSGLRVRGYLCTVLSKSELRIYNHKGNKSSTTFYHLQDTIKPFDFNKNLWWLNINQDEKWSLHSFQSNQNLIFIWRWFPWNSTALFSSSLLLLLFPKSIWVSVNNIVWGKKKRTKYSSKINLFVLAIILKSSIQFRHKHNLVGFKEDHGLGWSVNVLVKVRTTTAVSKVKNDLWTSFMSIWISISSINAAHECYLGKLKVN